MYDTVTTGALSKIINKPHVCPPTRSRLPTKMATKGKRPMRSLNLEEKILAIQRVNDGESKASVARDIGVPESTLRGWCKNEDKLRNHSTRKSSPESDKSIDSEPPDKRARISPSTQHSSETSGLDLTAPAVQLLTPPDDGPVELTTKRTVTSPMSHLPQISSLEQSISFGAPVSTVTGSSGPLAGLSYHGAGYNSPEICLNHKFNHEQSHQGAQHSSRTLRSVRSPKPAHNGSTNFNESKQRNRYHSLKLESDILRMFFQNNPAFRFPYQMLSNAAEFNYSPNNINLLTSLAYNKNDINRHVSTSMYQRTDVAAPPPSAYTSQTAQTKDNTILYNELTKNETEKQPTASSPPNIPVHTQVHKEEPRVETNGRPATGPDGFENKTPRQDQESGKNQTKGQILDNLFYHNVPVDAELSSASPPNDKSNEEAVLGMEHGTKFLEWLETYSNPCVTRQNIHQLRVLMNNLSASLFDSAHGRPSGSAHARTRRK